jgi:hypothetical protein
MTQAWRYHCQNPGVALRAIAHRAVMRSTVSLTLSQALSQNVATLTKQMRAMVHSRKALQFSPLLGNSARILHFGHPSLAASPARSLNGKS